MSVRLAHTWSSDLGIPWSTVYDATLEPRGYEIWHLTPDGPHAARARAQGKRWLPLQLSRRIDIRGDLAGACRLYRDLRRERFDIVHTHAIKVGLIARVVATAARVPVIVHTMHGLVYSMETPGAKRRLHALLERIASLRIDAILAQSREDAATLVATGVVPPERIIWVGNGIDLTCFRPARLDAAARAALRVGLGVAADDVLFFTAGRLVREKGVVELLEAALAARHEEPRVRLAIAGEADRDKADAIDSALLARARGAGVLVLGRRDDMPELYAAADVIALPSWREGMPRVLMEGAAMGKPLLASDVRGCREIVRAGDNGLLVPVRDPAALARAMVTLAREPELRARLGAVNRAEADPRYDVRRVAARLASIYEELLERARPRASMARAGRPVPHTGTSSPTA